MPDVTDFINGRPKQLSEKMKQFGSDISMEDLVYQGQRTNVVEYLRKLGWTVTEQSSADAHAANGFELPDNDMAQRFGKLSYVSAVRE